MRAFYLRIQAEEDHAQPAGVVRHALDLVNLATQGYSPWTRVNGSDLGNPINKVYDLDDPDSYPRFHPGHFPRDHGIEFLYLREMTELVKKGKL
jgi:hypothetical protein